MRLTTLCIDGGACVLSPLPLRAPASQPSRGCQGTGSIVENQIQKRRSKEGLLNLFDQAVLLHTRRIAGNSPSVSEALERQS